MFEKCFLVWCIIWLSITKPVLWWVVTSWLWIERVSWVRLSVGSRWTRLFRWCRSRWASHSVRARSCGACWSLWTYWIFWFHWSCPSMSLSFWSHPGTGTSGWVLAWTWTRRRLWRRWWLKTFEKHKSSSDDLSAWGIKFSHVNSSTSCNFTQLYFCMSRIL